MSRSDWAALFVFGVLLGLTGAALWYGWWM